MLHLKDVRLEKRKTQEQVADFLNISRASYTNIENGKRDPDTKTLIKLAHYFDVTTDYLLGMDERTSVDTISHEEWRLLEAFRSLNMRGREMANDMMMALAGNPTLQKSTTSATA